MQVWRLLVLGIALTLVWAAGVRAEITPLDRAERAIEALDAAQVLLDVAQGGKGQVAALTETVRAYEQALSAMRESLRAAAIRERVLTLDFEARKDQLSRLLGVLQTLERATTPLLLIHPTGPLGTARSGMMMSEVSPVLQQQAEELRLQLEELAALQAFERSAQQNLERGLDGVQQARVSLSQAISSRVDLPIRFLDDPVQLQILADNSKTLRSFAESLKTDAANAAVSTPIPFASAAGKVPLPTAGTILRGFNQEDAAGLKRPGIVLSTRPLSLITAPWDSTIRYAGPFLDYGNVMILEPEAGYLIVLAGLDRVYGESGEILEQGAPIGLLGGNDPAAEEFLIEASQGSGTIDQETLYIEIRENGTPTDPANWFAFSKK